MMDVTKEDVRLIVEGTVEKKTTHLATKTQVNEVLTKVDAFIKGLEAEEQEHIVGDTQLERRIEKLEQRT